MTYDEIRKVFLDYFESHGHKIVPSASLIPNDPTLLFTVAGMVPWKGILQGIEPAPAPRVADVQKCIRAGGKHNDLEDVGFDGRKQLDFFDLGFDDSAWPFAKTLSLEEAGWGKQVLRPIPQWKYGDLRDYVSTRMEGRSLSCQ